MSDLSPSDKLLEALLATDDPADKAALVAEAVLNGLSEIEATVARRCVILRWFDEAIVEILLSDLIDSNEDNSHSETLSAIYATLAALPFVERVPSWGLTYHALTREGLLKRYANTQPDLFLNICKLAAPIYAKRIDNEAVANETLFCYIVAGETKPALGLLDALLSQAVSRGNWQSLPTILQTQDEAEELPFVKPLPRFEYHWTIRAFVNYEQGNLEATIECYEQALRLSPNDSIIDMNIKHALADLENLKIAISQVKPELEAKALSGIDDKIKQALKTSIQSQSTVKAGGVTEGLKQISTQARQALHKSIQSSDAKSRLEHDLLLRLKSGDNHAWSYLTQEYSPRLYNFLLQKLPSSDDAQDIVGDTMVAAVRSIGTFDGKVTLSTFLFSLANYKLVDFWRRHQKTAELSDTFVDLASNTDGVEFREIFSALNEQLRDILLWRYQAGLGVDEIADLIGKTYKVTESLLSRAKQELKKALDRTQIGDDSPLDREISYAYEMFIGTIFGAKIDKNNRLRIYQRTRLIEEMQSILNELTEREKQILELRFGLRNGAKLTQREVGENFGLTGSRVGQIERDALEKLRNPTYMERLKPYLMATNEIPSEQKSRVPVNKSQGNAESAHSQSSSLLANAA